MSSLWAPGQSGNPNGRPPGSRNKRTKELFETLEGRGDKDPIDYLSDIVTNSKDESLRIQAAGLLTPYKHSKVAATPAPRYIETPITLPDFQTVTDAELFLGQIPVLVARGQLDFQSGTELSGMVTAWINAKYARDELRLKEANANYQTGDHIIKIQGGLPALPGTNVIMPQLNGHQVADPALPWSEPKQIEPEPPKPLPQPWAYLDGNEPLESSANDATQAQTESLKPEG